MRRVSGIRRCVGAIGLAIVVVGCSGGALCSDGQGPETVIVDASDLGDENTTVDEVCFIDESTTNRLCGESGSDWVSMSWAGDEYPASVSYEVLMSSAADSSSRSLIGGSYDLQCIDGSVRLHLGEQHH